MSDERLNEQGPPTARLDLGDVAAWRQRSAQQASADDADPAPEGAPAVPQGGAPADAVASEGSTGPSAASGAPADPDPPEGPPGDASEQPDAPLAEDADAVLGAQDPPAVALDVGDSEAAPPVTGGDAHDPAERGGPPPAADTFAAGQDAPVPAGFGQAGGLVPGVLSGSDDRSTIETEAPPFEPEGGTGADVHGPPGPAPDPVPSPAEASPASAEGTGADEGAAGGERADDLGSAALFQLDLGKLAERARASAQREAVPAAPRPLDPGPEPDRSPVTARDLQDPLLAPAPEPFPAPAPPPFPVRVTAPSAAEDEPGQPVAPELAPLVRGDATPPFDLSLDKEDDETQSTEADPDAGPPQGKLYGPVQAAARTRLVERPCYPRGRLREPIGSLRRIRAMLGIVVVTVLLGVAAGTAVGAFIFFLAFAVRNAITAQ